MSSDLSSSLHRHGVRDGEVSALGEFGYFVRDGFLGLELARRVRAEASQVELKRAGIKRAQVINDAVRTDEIAWLVPELADGAMREAISAFEALKLALNEAAFLGLRSFDLQLARYRPGARYVRHRDAFPGQDNRRLTAIVYLNEGWTIGDGGELELVVEPAPHRIAPWMDRLVVFRSELIEHEVLEARAERWALTAWFLAQ